MSEFEEWWRTILIDYAKNYRGEPKPLDEHTARLIYFQKIQILEKARDKLFEKLDIHEEVTQRNAETIIDQREKIQALERQLASAREIINRAHEKLSGKNGWTNQAVQPVMLGLGQWLKEKGGE